MLSLTALVITGCTEGLEVQVDTPIIEIRKPTDKLCVGEEEVEFEGWAGRESLWVIAYDDKGDRIHSWHPSELTGKQKEALRESGEVVVGDKRFIVEEVEMTEAFEERVILVGTNESSPPCEQQADDRTFPALINEMGLAVYPGEKQDGPNDYVDEPTTALLIIKIEGSEETAAQAIKDDLKDIEAKDIQLTDGADEVGYKIGIEATLEEKKIQVLLISSEAGTFAVYNITKPQ